MQADEFLARLQKVRDGKQMVDLLVQASIVAPPMPAPFPPELLTKVAPMNNTPWVPAGTHGEVRPSGFHAYAIDWANGKKEDMDEKKHAQYRLVYVY